MQLEPSYLMPRAVALIRNTTKTIGHILQGVSRADATTYRDGTEGWTVTEIVCHLRDFGTIFHDRAKRILSEDTPVLAPYDHEQMVIDGRCNEQDVEVVYADLVRIYDDLAGFYESIADDQWDRAGIHPDAGHFPLTKSMLQVGTHNALHIEQMTRVLRQKYSK